MDVCLAAIRVLCCRLAGFEDSLSLGPLAEADQVAKSTVFRFREVAQDRSGMFFP
jgi:hypothetical protein